MKVRDFLLLFGGDDDDMVSVYECDDNQTITATIKEFIFDGIYKDIMNSEIASWDYNDDDGLLCIYYFREEQR